MTIKEFQFAPHNHFVAMEYYALILNRTFLVLLLDKYIVGIKAHGLISVQSGDPVESLLSLSIDGDLQNPYSYLSMKYIDKIKEVDLTSDKLLQADRTNFRILRTDITEVRYDKRKKWGMGYYPHDGKVYVTTKDDREREFIILGSQSGEEICKWLK